MYYALLFIHILVCIVMIVSILMQAGKGGGLAGGAFGGAAPSGGQLFGAGGAASALTKVTTYAGVVFFLTCIGLWFTARTANPIPESAAERMLREQQTPTPLTQPAQLPTTTTIPGVETAPAATSGDATK